MRITLQAAASLPAGVSTNCGLDHHGYEEGAAGDITADTDLDGLDRLDEGTHQF